MIIVREVFIAKPGMASKLAMMFKEMMANGEMGPSRKARVMTDMTGVFNKVVMETEYESVAEFDKDMEEYMRQSKQQSGATKAKHVDMYTEGKREILRVW